MPQRILITGAAGIIGREMRSRLRRPDRVLRLLDVNPLPPADDDEDVEIITGSVTDAETARQACEGVDAVIHLAAHSVERPYPEIHDVNIGGTFQIFDAARHAGVRRVVFASSNHAVGYARIADGIPDGMVPRPDTYYGVSKAFGEALGSMYHDRYGMDIVCVRIGSCFPEPKDTRMLATWLSFDDAARLFEACVAAPSPLYSVVWGVSDNTRRWAPLEAARALGYEPRDNSEVFAEKVLAEHGELVPGSPLATLVGGGFTTAAYDAP